MGTNYAGFDYGRGMSNIDHETGIRYGVIHQHEVGQAWYDGSEPYYHYFCGECEEDIGEEPTDKCPNCGYEFEDYYFDGLEASSWGFHDETVTAECGDDGDIFITKSKYFTYAQFCSPCAPGAGYLRNPFIKDENSPVGYSEQAENTGFPKVYCFHHSWFEGGKAPYPVYSVETERLILPDEKKE